MPGAVVIDGHDAYCVYHYKDDVADSEDVEEGRRQLLVLVLLQQVIIDVVPAKYE